MILSYVHMVSSGAMVHSQVGKEHWHNRVSILVATFQCLELIITMEDLCLMW